MNLVRLRPTATDDLDNIWDYISQDSLERADNFLLQLSQRLETLASMPLMDIDRCDVLPGLRSFVIVSYIVFYQPAEDGIIFSALFMENAMFKPCWILMRDSSSRWSGRRGILLPDQVDHANPGFMHVKLEETSSNIQIVSTSMDRLAYIFGRLLHKGRPHQMTTNELQLQEEIGIK